MEGNLGTEHDFSRCMVGRYAASIGEKSRCRPETSGGATSKDEALLTMSDTLSLALET